MSTDAGSREGRVDAARPAWRAAARSDLRACADAGLHRVVPAIFVVALATVTATTAVLSEAFYASGDLPGTIRLLATNAAWLFTSLVALVGLFVGYPTFAAAASASRDALLGRLLARWLLVGGAVLLGFGAMLGVALAAYDPFSPVRFLSFALATAALAFAYVSLGIAVSLSAGSRLRALGWLLAAFFGLTFLWDTWIVPLGLLLLAAGGDPAALTARPAWFDALVASSPGGAYGAIAAAIADGSAGLLELYAGAALLGWIVAPPAIAAALARD